MGIKCLASDYVVKEKDGIYYVYNEMYEESLKALVIAALFGLLIPEAEDYYVPICIQIKEYEGNITIGKKLEVIGEADYSYFIAKHQYERWEKTYRIVKSVIFIFCFLIDILSVFLFWKTHFQLLMGVCVGVMLFLTIGAIAKLEWNNRKRKKYKVVDITF